MDEEITSSCVGIRCRVHADAVHGHCCDQCLAEEVLMVWDCGLRPGFSGHCRTFYS